MSNIPSAASDAILNADHPSPEDGGPCATCAFLRGTEANQTVHTMELVRLCVEGLREFDCHERPQLCRGWIAAVNLRGVPETEDERCWQIISGDVADMFSDMIAAAKAAEGKSA